MGSNLISDHDGPGPGLFLFCPGSKISDCKKAVSGGHTDDSFHLRIINGLNSITDASVEKSNTPKILWWVDFSPIGVFGDFSAMYLLEITNLSGAFDLLIDFEKHQWVGLHK
jgi:hypothetical protein